METRIESELLLDDKGNLIGEGIVKMKFIHTVKGTELIGILEKCVNGSVEKLKESMSPYERTSLFETWLYFVRQIEEFINIQYEYGKVFEKYFSHIHLDDEKYMRPVTSVVAESFGDEVAVRFQNLAKLFTGFPLYNFVDGKLEEHPIVTIADLMQYLKARRLHIMTILNLIPIYAQGDTPFRKEDINCKIKEWTEVLMNITGGCQAIIEAKCLPGFYAKVNAGGLEFCQQYTHLDRAFLEPQLMTPVELEQYRCDRLKERETKKLRSICSKEEYDIILRNETAYNESYGITEINEYKELMAFMNEMRTFFKEDYYTIEVPEGDFDRLHNTFGELELYKEMEDLDDIENSRYVFVKMDGVYYSTYFMLIRYCINTVMKMLRKKKKYQIDAGYVFEDQVKTLAGRYGFEVQKDCKRIERKEFDVVCVKGGTIYNFQCKNNYMNVSYIGLKETAATYRKNKQLISYYKSALRKEERREKLLTKKLGIDKVKHFVISRYPVMTDNERIIPFNRLAEWMENEN